MVLPVLSMWRMKSFIAEVTRQVSIIVMFLLMGLGYVTVSLPMLASELNGAVGVMRPALSKSCPSAMSSLMSLRWYVNVSAAACSATSAAFGDDAVGSQAAAWSVNS